MICVYYYEYSKTFSGGEISPLRYINDDGGLVRHALSIAQKNERIFWIKISIHYFAQVDRPLAEPIPGRIAFIVAGWPRKWGKFTNLTWTVNMFQFVFKVCSLILSIRLGHKRQSTDLGEPK